MPLGVRFDIGTINTGDTAELYAYLRTNDTPVESSEIEQVIYTVKKPNDELVENLIGEVQEGGKGYYQWKETTEIGQYLAKAQFIMKNGEKRSVMVNFTVEDPFGLTPVTAEELVTEEVWMRLEDTFDSVEGGPWLRDETLAHFDRNKIEKYIPEVLLDINVQMPPSNAVLADFTTPNNNGEVNSLLPMIAKGVLCKTIQHLIRSYVEQPVPQGGQVVWEDRTRYKDAWMTVYKEEHDDYMMMVRLWKRQMLDLGKSSMLIYSKSGRLYYGGVLRSRNIGRSWF